jgi:hypothetical protein
VSVKPPPYQFRSTRAGWRNWHLPLVAAIPLWIATTALLLVALLRIVAWDAIEILAVLNAITVILYLPAWFIAVVAAIGHRKYLVFACLLVVAAQLLFLYPELSAAEAIPTWAAHSPTVTLLDANVYNDNASMAGYALEIQSVKPKLLTMEEAVPSDVVQLTRAGALSQLPYRIQLRRDGPKAFLIASKYPLGPYDVVSYDQLPLIVQTSVHLPSGLLTLWVVHTTAPLPSTFAQWKGQLATVNRLVRARGTTGLLVVGDFNATWGNKGFRTILDGGLSDAAAARGRPFEMTWSQKMSPLPPLVRIDHLLTGPGVAVTTIRTGVGVGSDHRDLIGTIALRS